MASSNEGERAARSAHEEGAEARGPLPREPSDANTTPRDADETGAEEAERASTGEPDVFLHVPLVKVDEISFEVDELRARVALHAAVGDLVKLDVGADVSIGRVKLEIKGVEAQALLKVRLNNVYAILARTLTTVDRHPELLEAVLKPLGETVGAVGRTVEEAVPPLTGSVGRTVEEAVPPLTGAVGKTVEKAVPPLTGAVGKTVEKTVPEVTGAVGKTVEKTVPEVTGTVGRTVEHTVPEVAAAAKQTVKDVTSSAGAAVQRVTPEDVATKNVAAPAPPSRPSAPSASAKTTGRDEREIAPLFDGTESSFKRWRHVGAGSSGHDDGTLHLRGGDDLGLVYFAANGFDDFRMQVQYRPERGAQVGLAVRFSNPEHAAEKLSEAGEEAEENSAYVALDTGFEVHLGGQRPAVEPGTFNGVQFGKAAGAQRHPHRAEVNWGEWNALELVASGDEYSVLLNGTETARFTNVDAVRGRRAAEQPGAGFVGFLLRGGQVRIRRVELHPELPEKRGAERTGSRGNGETRGRGAASPSVPTHH